MTGLVIRNTGSHYTVLTPDGLSYDCRAKGNFRIRGIRTTNPVAVGDEVTILPPAKDGEAAWITHIAPRRNYIIRRASNLSKESHIIAANIDAAMLVVTLFHPTTSTTFIDRFLATAEAYGVEAEIVINKVDLLKDDPEAMEYLEAVTYLYESIGYKVWHVSAKAGEGLEELRKSLEGRTTLLAGNSGVGKSTIINHLIPGADLKTGDLSAAHDAGMHTTTFSQMLNLPDGKGRVIDTPGVRGFGTIDFDRYETAHYFRDLFKESEGCRFDNCSHTHEPGCAVRKAVEEGRIAQSRYASYLSILEDTQDADKYRKPF